MPKSTKKIGLALSGGGYRAAAFHLGTLKKLKELNILDKIQILSTVSGGSIIGAYYMINKANFDNFASSFEKTLQISTEKKALLSKKFIMFFSIVLILLAAPFLIIGLIFPSISFAWAILFIVIVLGIVIIFLFNFISTSDLVERAYNKIFFHGEKLSKLLDKPTIVINTTNLESGRIFSFSQDKMKDSYYENLKDENNKKYKILFEVGDFPISVAVAASTAIPGLLNPIKIFKKHFKKAEQFKLADPSLVDGGLYDNQGIHKITHRLPPYMAATYKCDYVICSDAATPFPKKFKKINPLPIFKRIQDVMMFRIKNLQTMFNVYNNPNLIKEISYFSIDWEYQGCIDGFVESLYDGNIRKNVVAAHKIPSKYYSYPNIFKKNDIKNFMKERINYKKITQYRLKKEEIKSISKITTRLRALKKEQIQLLTRHASILTEIQIKLYCPTII